MPSRQNMIDLVARTKEEEREGRLAPMRAALAAIEQLGEKAEALHVSTRRFLLRWAAEALSLRPEVVRRDGAVELPPTYAEWLEQNLSSEDAWAIQEDAGLASEFISALPESTFYDLMDRYRYSVEERVYGDGEGLDRFLATRELAPFSIDNAFLEVLAWHTSEVISDSFIARIEQREIAEATTATAAQFIGSTRL